MRAVGSSAALCGRAQPHRSHALTLQVFGKEQRQKRNYLIHLLYVRKEYSECLDVIEDTLAQVNQLAEYPLYVKALILRHNGKINESLGLFQKAARLNPLNVENLKQVARSLFLLGKHKAALDYLDEAVRMGHVDDWEIWHNKGLCLAYLRKFDDAKEALQRANSIQRHDSTFMQLGQILTQEEDYKGAVETYLEALEFSPENPELLTTIGLLYLRMGENFRAFDFLGNSLTHDATNAKTILAAGSIIQDHSDMDVALIKVLLLAGDGAGACRGAVTHAGVAAADQATHTHKNNVAHTASLTRLSRIAVRYLLGC